MLRVLLIVALLIGCAWAVSAQVPVFQGSMGKAVSVQTGSGIAVTDVNGNTLTVNRNSPMGLLAQARTASGNKFTFTLTDVAPGQQNTWHPYQISGPGGAVNDANAGNWGVLVAAVPDYDPVRKQFTWANTQANPGGIGITDFSNNLVDNAGANELNPQDPAGALCGGGFTGPDDKGVWVIVAHTAGGVVAGVAPDQYIAFFCKITRADIRVFVSPDSYVVDPVTLIPNMVNPPRVQVDNSPNMVYVMFPTDHIGGTGEGSTSSVRFPDLTIGNVVAPVLGTHTVQVSIPGTAYKAKTLSVTLKRGKANRFKVQLTI